MGTYSSVACEEVHGSKSESGSLESFSASVKLRCAYADRLTLAADLIENARQWPYFSLATARTVAITPEFGAYTTSDQSCEYSSAILTVGYNTLADADLLSESIEPTAEFRLLDHRLFRWSSATGAVITEKEAPGQIIRGLNIVRTIYRMPSVPTTILSLPGSVNNTAYSSSLLGLTFAAETLLFGTGSINRVIKLSGTAGFNVTVKMSFKGSGWNKFWRQTTSSYENIYLYGGALYKPYPPASFSDWLF